MKKIITFTVLGIEMQAVFPAQNEAEAREWILEAITLQLKVKKIEPVPVKKTTIWETYCDGFKLFFGKTATAMRYTAKIFVNGKPETQSVEADGDLDALHKVTSAAASRFPNTRIMVLKVVLDQDEDVVNFLKKKLGFK